MIVILIALILPHDDKKYTTLLQKKYIVTFIMNLINLKLQK